MWETITWDQSSSLWDLKKNYFQEDNKFTSDHVFEGAFSYAYGEGNGNPLQCSCLENPRDWGEPGGLPSMGLQSRTRLKRLSSSMEIIEFVYIALEQSIGK